MFAQSGELIADYAKQHLVPGFEARFKPGDEDVVRSIEGTRFGVAICKDMDFAQLGRTYSRLGVDAMLVPAYDFDRDASLHASMAVLRGVEGGFSVVRSARHGFLTVSDRYGRIVDHKASADATTLGLDSNIALLPMSGFSAKLLMSSRICQTTTLYRLILASDSPSKQKIKNAK